MSLNPKPVMRFERLTDIVDNCCLLAMMTIPMLGGLLSAFNVISGGTVIWLLLTPLVGGPCAAVGANVFLKACLPEGHPRKRLKHPLLGGKESDI